MSGRVNGCFAVAALILCLSTARAASVTMTLDQVTDRVSGGELGALVGGEWGAAFEFNGSYTGRVVPDADLKPWVSSTGQQNFNVNFMFGGQGDQIWSEIPYLDALRTFGVFTGWPGFGASWRDYPLDDGGLYSANILSRNSLRNGLQAPDSGFYTRTNNCAENQTWQMEANWAGMVCPGQPQHSVDLSWRAGHVSLYADGVHGGVAISAMQAAAYTATSAREIVEAGRQAVPVGSAYREMIEDVIAWHDQNPTLTFEEVWQLIYNKWGHDPYLHSGASQNICVRINGANIFLGLLYGNDDFELTVRTTIRGGEDADCSGDVIGGIMGTYLGFSRIPDKFKVNLSHTTKFISTPVNFDDVVNMAVASARDIVTATGGSVATVNGVETWTIPASGTIVPPLVEKWPKTTTNSTPPALTASATVIGHTAKFSASATPAAGAQVNAYQWFFGDLEHADGANLSHTYAADGIYQATGYVNDNYGNTTWKIVHVAIGLNPGRNLQIDTGGGASGAWWADGLVTGGDVGSKTAVVSVAGVTNAAPAEIYQTRRYGIGSAGFTYTIPQLQPNAGYTVRLHFSEPSVTQGQRIFNVKVNGVAALTNFDIYSAAGGQNKAVVRDILTTATAAGEIVIQFSNGNAGVPLVNGIEILPVIQALAINLTAPASNAVFTAPADVMLDAVASGPNPITQVEFFSGVTSLGSATTEPYTFTWSAVPPGTYTLMARVTDSTNATADTNKVTITVEIPNTPPSISLALPTAGATFSAPASVSISADANDPDGAVAKVEFFQAATKIGESAGPDFSFVWMNVPGGIYSITARATDNRGATTTSAATSITVNGGVSALSINCGGGAVSPFAADKYFGTGTNTSTTANTISLAGVANPAPLAVYQSGRYALNLVYTVPGLTANAPYTVRMHFAEFAHNAAGQRVFNLSINGTQVLTNFDVFAAAGAMNKAVVKEFSTAADGSGIIVITGVASVDNAKFNGIEVIAAGGGSSAPVITSSLAINSAVNAPFSYTITADNSPTSYNATGLPAGLSVSASSGVISGTPAAIGTTNVTISATNNSGTGTAALSLMISAPAVYQINCGGGAVAPFATDNYFGSGTNTSATANTISLAGVVNPAPLAVYQSGRYASTLTYTFPGLTANAPYTVRMHFAEFAHNAAGQRLFNLSINGTQVLTSFDVFAAAGGEYKALVKEFPATANSSGAIAVTGVGIVDNAKFNGIEIVASVGAPAITSALTASGAVNQPFSYQIEASNTPTSYDAAGLPAGLTFDPATGLIYGTPAAVGTATVTISATNDNGSAAATLSLAFNSVGDPPTITSAATASGTVGQPFSYQITASGNPASFDALDLPAGLSVDTNSGMIVGMISFAETAIVSISATNDSGTSTTALTITISAANHPPVVNSVQAGLNPAQVNETIIFTASATDADALDTLMYSWDFHDGSPAAGGASVSHGYTTTGSHTATVTVTDGNGGSASSDVIITINIAINTALYVTGNADDTGADSDGDGFSDKFETASNENLNDAANTPFDNNSAAAATAALAGKTALSIKLNFVKTLSDSIYLKGKLPLKSSDLPLNGRKVVVDIGGYITPFVLGANGKSPKSKTASFAIGIKPKNGVSRFSYKIVKSTLASFFADEGMTKTARQNTIADTLVTVLFNNAGYQTTVHLLFTQTKGMSGKTKPGP